MEVAVKGIRQKVKAATKEARETRTQIQVICVVDVIYQDCANFNVNYDVNYYDVDYDVNYYYNYYDDFSYDVKNVCFDCGDYCDHCGGCFNNDVGCFNDGHVNRVIIFFVILDLYPHLYCN